MKRERRGLSCIQECCKVVFCPRHRYLHRRFGYLGQRVHQQGAELGPVELQILLFADDIVLVADKIQDLQNMLHVADEYSRMYRFGFNGSKSNVVVFSGRKEEAR